MRQVHRLVERLRGKYDVLAHAERYEHPKFTDAIWYSVEPDDIYPATIARIVDCLGRSEPFPEELIDRDSVLPDGVAAALVAEARGVAPAAWEWAQGPVEDYAPGTFERIERAKALECARRWFTQALHVKVRRSVGIKILKDERYRL